ncbi:hypothetical protein C7293_00840 [filamentous cyanobacterium CCT1]|nr:hypothetical protein C7293_00840 [filamentous cyanobacterium CCT1]PSN80956.1 hypothetical protein C8B47_03825 [filamentous cyanobacterium CCP4]
MNIENLVQLSFEQLDEIHRRISTAIHEKRIMRVGNSASDILDLMATNYSDVDLWDVLNELAFRSQLKVDLKSSSISYKPVLNETPNLKEDQRPELSFQNIQILSERLKTIRNSVLQHDDSRLLWLTSGATQKTSKMFGKDLAEVLQEATKRLDRLHDVSDEDEQIKDLSSEVIKIDEWAEFKLGISLLYGTLTVINPFSSRDNQTKDNPRTSQRLPTSENSRNKASLELSFYSNQRKGASGYVQ